MKKHLSCLFVLGLMALVPTKDLYAKEELTVIQQQILQEYSSMLKKGGVLVYATCSILPIENDKQIDAFLEINKQFQLEKKQTIYPSAGGDGYFMARLVKL